MLQTTWQDLRYGVRMFGKSRGFTAIAVLTLALGIGANTALFSVINGVLLSPLPFVQANQLVTLSESKPNFEYGSISYPNFRDWQKENRTLSSLAVYRSYSFSLTGAGEALQVKAEFISSDTFPLLGVKPLIGRTFVKGEDEIGAAPIALLAEGLWRRKFGAREDILGKAIVLDGKSYVVVGVIPASFHISVLSFPDNQEVFAPIGQWNNPLLNRRGAGLGIHGMGRLKPGVTIQQAQADMDSVTSSLAATYPDTDKGIGAKLMPLRRSMLGGIQPTLLMLFAAVGFVLLIACVNVANLLLARSTGRTREFAVRAALGAPRSRVVRQLLTECILISVIGGALGLLLAAWGTRAALGVLPAALPRAEQVGLDGRVLLFTAGISLLAGILFGLAPALKTSRTDLNEALKQGARGTTTSRHGAQMVFVVAEMALALVLLIGAGLMVRSLSHLWRTDPGFDPHNAMTFGLSLPPSMMNAQPEAIRATIREFDRKIAALPGVAGVSQTWGAVPLGWDDEQLFWFEGQPKPTSQSDMNWAINYIVESDYLRVMGIPLRQGRFFTAQDNEHAPLVIAIDDVFAQKYFPNENPIGKRINIDGFNQPAEIVGLVGHVRQWGLDSDDTELLRAQIYIPCMQMPDPFIAMAPSGGQVVVRSTGAVPDLYASIRQANAEMSTAQVLFGAQTMEQIISDSLAPRRFSVILLGTFAGLALLLASIGIYGVISYVVGQRSNEIGVRIALGAKPQDILRLVLADGGRLVLLGIGIGLAAAFGLTQLIKSFLYGVDAADPLTFSAVAVLLSLVALAACYVPARRATRVDPVIALRYE
jgi:putative ABC transport system permease protein